MKIKGLIVMFIHRIRLRNRLRQAMYRPRSSQYTLFSAEILRTLDEINKSIEDNITPMFAGLL